MQIIADIPSLRAQIKQYQSNGKRIGFVPTMGNLHEGHLTLVRRAHENADVVITSIFVNPMQFERADDLANYPRTLDEDCDKLKQANVSLVFTPTPEIMYPNGLAQETFVEVPGMSHQLEGASRPGHFRGVTTIVSKLFHLIQPDVACFGEKDYQQLAIIRQMVQDQCFDIEIISVPTVREHDDLAMSSRNNRLTEAQRQQAPRLAHTMKWIRREIESGREDFDAMITEANQKLIKYQLAPDEIFIRDAQTLSPVASDTRQIVILMSAFLGSVRLIDNCVTIRPC